MSPVFIVCLCIQAACLGVILACLIVMGRSLRKWRKGDGNA